MKVAPTFSRKHKLSMIAGFGAVLPVVGRYIGSALQSDDLPPITETMWFFFALSAAAGVGIYRIFDSPKSVAFLSGLGAPGLAMAMLSGAGDAQVDSAKSIDVASGAWFSAYASDSSAEPCLNPGDFPPVIEGRHFLRERIIPYEIRESHYELSLSMEPVLYFGFLASVQQGKMIFHLANGTSCSAPLLGRGTTEDVLLPANLDALTFLVSGTAQTIEINASSGFAMLVLHGFVRQTFWQQLVKDLGGPTNGIPEIASFEALSEEEYASRLRERLRRDGLGSRWIRDDPVEQK